MSEAILTISTLNIQGMGKSLEGTRKRRETKEFLQKVTPRPEIALIQEHKFSLQECIKKSNQLGFTNGTTLWSEATYSANKDSFKGGVGILLSSRMASLVCEHGVIEPGRAQYVTVQWTNNIKVGIINIYAYNFTGSRARLWNKIRQFNLPEANWILAGDFNMIEQLSDKQGGNRSTGRGQAECTAWNALTIQLELYDTFLSDEFRITSAKKFTWENRRRNTDMICSRIDRFYVNTYLRSIGGITGIWPSMPHISDHALVFLQLHKRGFKISRHTPFNRRMMLNREEKTLLLTAWKKAMVENAGRSFQSKTIEALKAVKACSDSFTKQLKQDIRDKFQQQYEEVIEAEIDLQENWGSVEARDTLNAAQIELHIIRQMKMEMKYERILANWTRTGDRCTKEFFEYHTGFKRPSPIKELHDGDKILRTQEELQAYADNYYTNLYTRDEAVEENNEARHECFRSVPEFVTAEQNDVLTRALEVREVIDAVKALPTGKAPGLDGIPAEFFKGTIDDVRGDLWDVINEVFQEFTLKRTLNTSRIGLHLNKGTYHV